MVADFWSSLSEKEYAVELWKQIRDDFKQIRIDDEELREFIENSIEYGLRFFDIVRLCFYIFDKYRKQKSTKQLLKEYDAAWAYYRELEQRPQASTSYHEEYYSTTNGTITRQGWNEVMAYCREKL